MDKREINKMYKEALKLEKELKEERKEYEKYFKKEVKALCVFQEAQKIKYPISRLGYTGFLIHECPQCESMLEIESIETELFFGAWSTQNKRKYEKFTCKKCSYKGGRISTVDLIK